MHNIRILGYTSKIIQVSMCTHCYSCVLLWGTPPILRFGGRVPAGQPGDARLKLLSGDKIRPFKCEYVYMFINNGY